MREMIERWKQFMKWWKIHGTMVPDVNNTGEKRQFKPTFFDFMEWCAKNIQYEPPTLTQEQ